MRNDNEWKFWRDVFKHAPIVALFLVLGLALGWWYGQSNTRDLLLEQPGPIRQGTQVANTWIVMGCMLGGAGLGLIVGAVVDSLLRALWVAVVGKRQQQLPDSELPVKRRKRKPVRDEEDDRPRRTRDDDDDEDDRPRRRRDDDDERPRRRRRDTIE